MPNRVRDNKLRISRCYEKRNVFVESIFFETGRVRTCVFWWHWLGGAGGLTQLRFMVFNGPCGLTRWMVRIQPPRPPTGQLPRECQFPHKFLARRLDLMVSFHISRQLSPSKLPPSLPPKIYFPSGGPSITSLLGIKVAHACACQCLYVHCPDPN